MKAVILAGGRGSRLDPLTRTRPKPMLPLAGKPVLAHILELLKYHRVTDVIITVRYLAEQILAYFGDGRAWGMRIHYAIEDTPLGTAGSVKNAQAHLDDAPFMVLSGDAITDINLSRVMQFHRQKGALATIVLKQVIDPDEYGVVITNCAGRILRYIEKPKPGQFNVAAVNTGIYILEPAVLAAMRPNVPYDFAYDIFPALLRQHAPLYGYLAAGYWRDMGTISSYIQAADDIAGGKIKQILWEFS